MFQKEKAIEGRPLSPTEINTIKVVDCLEGLRNLPDCCVQCCVTSPPYWKQRDYEMLGQFGLEETPELYVDRLAEVFGQVNRVLKRDGTLWLNLGDAFWGSGKAGNNPNYHSRHKEFGKISVRHRHFGMPTTGKHPNYKNKDLIGLPWMVAFALRRQGWYLRQDVIWHKRNCMPESVSDRCTRAHEYIFMFSKSAKYYYDADAIATVVYEQSLQRLKRGTSKLHKYAAGAPGQAMQGIARQRLKQKLHPEQTPSASGWETSTKANRRSVWDISLTPFKERHFATFPLEIPMICIKAGSRENDIILDPFMGAGTTGLAAALLNRDYIGFELNPEYASLAKRRIQLRIGMFYRSNISIESNGHIY
ncbi:MAG TPA: site-specific DNA-methyltransferase [Agriterribacter sp.]|jgi:DNA modification methylase|nr:site-specific DNA-methyltransferase [Agriterribacter sp.]